MKILVIGANGLCGSTFLRVLSKKSDWEVYGTVRNAITESHVLHPLTSHILSRVDVLDFYRLTDALDLVRPDVVINCAGLTKHKPKADDPLVALPINSMMPHRLAKLCKLVGTRLIHISTDCVFSGLKGNYLEEDITDAVDVYGKSKALGEVFYPNTVTLRTSMIGHEKYSKNALLEWFLSQEIACEGFSRGIFSGLPTFTLAEIIRDVVIPNKLLTGLYHVAARPINKFELLQLIARIYEKEIEITENAEFVLDRSLDSSRFFRETGYSAPGWEDLIESMRNDYAGVSNVQG